MPQKGQGKERKKGGRERVRKERRKEGRKKGKRKGMYVCFISLLGTKNDSLKFLTVVAKKPTTFYHHQSLLISGRKTLQIY